MDDFVPSLLAGFSAFVFVVALVDVGLYLILRAVRYG